MPAREHLNGVLIPLLDRVRVAVGVTKSMQEALGVARAELMRYASTEATSPANELPGGATRLLNNWLELALREVEGLNAEGSSAIGSLTEAHWKVHGLMNWWHQNERGRFFFRGEHHSDWQLVSSAARAGLSPDPSSLLTVSATELHKLEEFQAEVQADRDLLDAVFPDGHMLPLDASDWWGLMQHYRGGTRLVDITSSAFCALFFACADWTGTVDEFADGAMYLFPDARWCPAVQHVPLIQGRKVDVADQAQPQAAKYFDLDDHPEGVRFRRSDHRNDRLIAQDGFFLWQPRFYQPLSVGQIFKFRVPAARKKNVLRELYSIGYTAERLVRGPMGSKAHSVVCEQIGVRE